MVVEARSYLPLAQRERSVWVGGGSGGYLVEVRWRRGRDLVIIGELRRGDGGRELWFDRVVLWPELLDMVGGGR